MEHFSEDEYVSIWCDVFEDCFNCGGCDCDGRKKRQIKKLNDRQLEALQTFLEDELQDIPEDDTCWWGSHTGRVVGWMNKTGLPVRPKHGELAKCSSLLLRNFGLSLWTTHTQTKKGKTGQFAQNTIYASTAAYFVLPCNKYEDTFERGVCEWRSIPWVDTEAGGAVPVNILGELSNEDAGKFARALKVLDVTPICEPASKAPLHTSSENLKKIEADGGKESVAAVKKDQASRPSLRLLYSNVIGEDF